MVEWIEEPERFLALEAEWDRLCGETAAPFLQHSWFAAWDRAFRPSGRLRVAVLRRDGELSAAFPLWVRRGHLHGLASTEHSDFFRPLGRTDEDLETIVEAVLSSNFRDMTLPSVPAEHAATAMLVESARRRGQLAVLEPWDTCPVVETRGSFEDYMRARPRDWRSKMRRRRRRAERDHRLELSLLERPLQLDGPLRACFELEAEGWKGRSGTAILSSPSTHAFWRSIAEAFQARGRLVLSELSLDGQLVAFDLAVLSAGRLWSLKGSYDERFRALAPGLLLELAIVERCFELGLAAQELLAPEADWKGQFATGSRRTERLRIYAPRAFSPFRYGYQGTVRPALKRAVRRVQRSLGRRAAGA